MAKPGRIYKWRKGAPFSVSAQVAGEYLEDLMEQNDGVLTPTDVYEAAMDKESPIHGEFEWDVEKAARNHWRERARKMMNHIVVHVSTNSPEKGFPVYLNVVVTSEKRGYVSADTVYSVQNYREQVIDQALKLLKGLQTRFGQLQEFDEIWEAILKAEEVRAKKLLE